MVTRSVKNLARYGVEKGLIQKCYKPCIAGAGNEQL